MRAWPILALVLLGAFLVSLAALAAGPSFLRLCDGSISGIETGSAESMCERLIGAARAATLVSGALLLGTLALGAVTLMGRRTSGAHDDAPLVSVHARKR